MGIILSLCNFEVDTESARLLDIRKSKLQKNKEYDEESNTYNLIQRSLSLNDLITYPE